MNTISGQLTTLGLQTSIKLPKGVKLYKDQNKGQVFSNLSAIKLWQFLQLTIAVSLLSKDWWEMSTLKLVLPQYRKLYIICRGCLCRNIADIMI